MRKEEEFFIKTGGKITNAVKSQMFGKPCFKINGKAFVCFFRNEMVFKLSGEARKEALSFEGSKLFDPSGKNRPMKEWVQLPYDHKDFWDKFAMESANYVTGD